MSISNLPPSPIDEPSERTKIHKDWEFREREIALREREVHIGEGELELKRIEARFLWKNPIIVAIFVAAAAAIGNAIVTLTNADAQRTLESEKAEQARILEMLKADSTEKAIENLRFLLNLGLVNDPFLKQELQTYVNLPRKAGQGALIGSRDPTRGIEQVRLAAEAGDSIAQNNLAYAYANGAFGVQQDNKPAALWYKRSAEGGSPSAQYVYGTYCEQGTGDTPKDIKEALKWYRLSASAGVPAAKDALTRIEKEQADQPAVHGKPTD